MMRDKMLKRLDDLIDEVTAMRTDPQQYGLLAGFRWNERWLAIRAELVAERCENCAHWSATTSTGKIRDDWGECGTFEDDTSSNFYCAYFEKKKEP